MTYSQSHFERQNTVPVTDDIKPSDPAVDISIVMTESLLDAIEIIRANWPGDERPSRSYAIRELVRLGIVAAHNDEATT